ncbi:hypothetical protein ACHAW6_016200 [Cyclotella cf. meneghiniana]
MHMQPSVLGFDDLDNLIPNVESGDLSSDGSIHHRLTNLLQSIQCWGHYIKQSRSCLSMHMQRQTPLSSHFMGMIHWLFEVPSFDAHQQTEFLGRHLLGSTMKSKEISHFTLRLGRLTDGYRPQDLQQIVQQFYNISSTK